METIRLSTKGQLVIPADLRARHHWGAGTEFFIEDRGDALVLRATKPFEPTSVEESLGCTGYAGPVKSLEAMGAGVAADLRRRWQSGNGA
ncbi:AbrB/MazE/SpoVT family DNA-binding domain-containing protein [uncultured Thiodictyon sp.]|uniref:AbrB/MazE/SpoVT family DNA-binding domain-containing protein n=1 Tax=uncultured Thiodictyon sp. TaxID=1846217 RepID=UPI0025EA507A|nr:AbrB/MazE/SpoVT family DNA-binding domain-containing protein [uncultured Thiodictyon sp.]